MSDSVDAGPVQRTQATVHRSRWPGWIWAVPLAALAIGIWLGVRAIAEGGIGITIEFDQASGMHPGNTNVRYRGLKVGSLSSLTLSKDGQHVEAEVKINKSVKKYLRTGTQFWLEGINPSFSDLSSLKGVITGPTIIMQPGDGAPTRHFAGLDHRPGILQSRDKLVRYTMSFDGAVGQINPDAPVRLRGFTVGMVEGIALKYDAATHRLETPVIVALDPERFHIQGGLRPINGQWKPVMDEVLQQLISEGMRGQLTQSPPFIGSYNVSLDFVAGASNAQLTPAGNLTQIPTVSTGGPNSIIQRVNDVPIDKIAQQILEITNQIRGIVSSPSLHDSIKHLDQTLAELDRTVRVAGPQITQLAISLRQTASEMDITVKAANRVLGASPASQDSNVRTALHELTETARSVRALADYLDRHPEALIRGNT
jgi:paraquat-inducible protein B